VVVAAEYLLAEPLNLLVTALLDADHDPAVRAHLNAAANHVSLALSRLARIDLPARQDPNLGSDLVVATAGGLGSKPPVAAGECLAPGSGAASDSAVTESGGDLVDPVAGALLPSGPALGLAAAPPISGGSDSDPDDGLRAHGAGGSRRQAPGATRGGEGGNRLVACDLSPTCLHPKR
jgi:hypothetical protein